MRFILATIVSMVLALPAAAQWYARGEFNGWPGNGDTSNQLIDLGGGHFSGTVSTPQPNTTYEYKIADLNWTQTTPGNNGKVTSNSSSLITFHLYDNFNWTDHWFPAYERRVGYEDPGVYGWEVMGSFNGFSTPLTLTNQGNGLYSAYLSSPAGAQEFKFRQAGTWDGVQFGPNFSNGGSNNTYFAANSGDLFNFQLDLPHGRWRAEFIDGDFNADHRTNTADYVGWRKNDGNALTYGAMRSNFGQTGWYVRGTFGNAPNPWDDASHRLVDLGNGHLSSTVTGLTPGQDYEYKVTNHDDYIGSVPGSNGKVRADNSGQVVFHFYEKTTPTWGDGWSPDNDNRVGYDDPHKYGWEIVGDFNGFPITNDPAYALIDQGNGLYSKSFQFPAGTYGFKFRHITSDQTADPAWNTSIGDNFGNAAGNNSFTVLNNNDTWTFQLDLPHGRWRAISGLPSALLLSEVPEPASVAMAMFAMALFGMVRRKRR